MNQSVSNPDLIWWILRAPDIVEDTLRLVNIAHSVSSTETAIVDSTLERILEILPKIKKIEEETLVPFPYKKDIIDARLNLVFNKNSTYIESI
jgi:hypothetical protein